MIENCAPFWSQIRRFWHDTLTVWRFELQFIGLFGQLPNNGIVLLVPVVVVVRLCIVTLTPPHGRECGKPVLWTIIYLNFNLNIRRTRFPVSASTSQVHEGFDPSKTLSLSLCNRGFGAAGWSTLLPSEEKRWWWCCSTGLFVGIGILFVQLLTWN